MNGPQLRTRYCPPAPEVIDQFARTACAQLGAEFADPEISRGFAAFMKAMARAYANNLNRETEQMFDNEADQE